MKSLFFSFAFILLTAATAGANQTKEFFYVASHTVRGGSGIYVLEFDRANGTLNQVQIISIFPNPTFLDFHPNGKFLYAVGELDNKGLVGAFSVDSLSGRLTFINQRWSEGEGAAHIAIDHTGKFAYVSNYRGGSFAILPIGDDGSVSVATQVIHYTGGSINKERQQKSFVHSANVSPDNRFVMVADLGTDKIHSYKIDYITGKVNEVSSVRVAPGAGPRHLVFHPNGKHLFSSEELYSTVGVFMYESSNGALQIVRDTVRSLPAAFTAFNKSADIHIDPKGKFLYMSNRGLNAISIFFIQRDGTIKLIGQQESMGKTPRSFLIDPKGEFLFVANQDSDNIVIFKLDQERGTMTYAGNQVSIPSPVCVKMLLITEK